jgi:hypothetical protein
MKKIIVIALAVILTGTSLISRADINRTCNATIHFWAWVGRDNNCDPMPLSICIIIPIGVADGIMDYDATTGSLSLQVPSSSDVYGEMGTSQTLGQDTRIDPNVAAALGFSGNLYIKAGTYPVTYAPDNTATLQFGTNFYIVP